MTLLPSPAVVADSPRKASPAAAAQPAGSAAASDWSSAATQVGPAARIPRKSGFC